jgi:hypothetical protein
MEPESPARGEGRRRIAAALALLRSTGPILRREFVGLLRTRKVYWLTVLTVAGCGLLPLLWWPPGGSPMPSAAAHNAYLTYLAIAGAAILIAVPALAATSIAGERERRTYESLLATRVEPSAIVLGKVLVSALLLLLLGARTKLRPRPPGRTPAGFPAVAAPRPHHSLVGRWVYRWTLQVLPVR